MSTYAGRARAYAERVTRGEEAAGKFERLACRRFLNDLERQGAASNKAIQLLLEEARRGRLRYGKFLKPVLEVLKDVDVRIGEVDAYTGRDYTSATLRLSDRWLTSFSIDDDNRSRGLLIFVLRFR